MLDVTIDEIKEAMKWFKSLSEAQKLHYRKRIAREDVISIAWYWKLNIKTGT